MTLPDGWRMVRLGEAADTALGKMLDKGKSKDLPRVRYLRNVNVQWGRIDTHNLFEMELADDERERFGVEPGDLLVCEGGDIGRTAIWCEDGEYIAFQKALHRVRPSGALDSVYLRYALEHASKKGVLAALSTGSTIAHLPQQQLRRVPIALPPLDEQRRIVEILEEHLSSLDAGVSNLRKVSRRLDLVIASFIALRVRDAPWVTVGDLAVQASYGTSLKCVPGGAGPAVIRIPNIIDGEVDMSDEKRAEQADVDLEALMVREGDVLIVRTNGSRGLIGRSAVVSGEHNASFASYLIRYRVNPALVRPVWLRRALELPNVRRTIESLAASSAGQYNLSLGKLAGLAVPVPALTAQDDLMRAVEALESGLKLQRNMIAAQERRSTALRRALLQAAFSGQLAGGASDLDRLEEAMS